MTQNESILNYLKLGNRITPLEALEKFGCFRLGARCWDLRNDGHNIKSELTSHNGKHYSVYWLEPPDKLF